MQRTAWRLEEEEEETTASVLLWRAGERLIVGDSLCDQRLHHRLRLGPLHLGGEVHDCQVGLEEDEDLVLRRFDLAQREPDPVVRAQSAIGLLVGRPELDLPEPASSGCLVR